MFWNGECIRLAYIDFNRQLIKSNKTKKKSESMVTLSENVRQLNFE